MAIALVQHTSSLLISGNGQTVAYPSNQVAGNMNLLEVIMPGATRQVVSVTDTLGNKWVRAVGFCDANGALNDTVEIWYATRIKSGANTITISDNATGGEFDIWIQEFSGISVLGRITTGDSNNNVLVMDAGTYLDTQFTVNPTNGPVSLPSAAVGVSVYRTAGGNFAAGAGWTAVDSPNAFSQGAEYIITTKPQTVRATASQGGANVYVACAAYFYPASRIRAGAQPMGI